MLWQCDSCNRVLNLDDDTLQGWCIECQKVVVLPSEPEKKLGDGRVEDPQDP